MIPFLGQGLLALMAGVLLNLTPCVLPAIPLKIRTVIRATGTSARQRLGAATALMAGDILCPESGSPRTGQRVLCCGPLLHR